jgi:hypothetical protein
MTADRALLLSDEEILGALAAAFPVDPVEPDAVQLFRLSMAVAELRQRTATTITPSQAQAPAATAALAAARRQRWSLPRHFSPAVLAAAAIGVLGAGTGISYAAGVPIPAAVRDVARSVGLAKPTAPAPTPTTLPPATAPSPDAAATAARQAEATLHQALTQSNPPPAVIWRDSAVLAHRLFGAGGHPTAGTAGATADGQQLLNEACRQLEGSGQATTGSSLSRTATGGTTAAFPGCGPVGIWHDPSSPTNPSSIVPSGATGATGTTGVPSSSHSGTGTGSSPFKGPAGGSSGISSGGTRTGGSTRTTPGLSPGHGPGGSSGDRSGFGTSSNPSNPSTSPSHDGDSHSGNSRSGNEGTVSEGSGDDSPGATDPRSGATSG